MSTFTKILIVVSSIFILVGSFLPWRRDGDFISYWTHGIQVYPSIKDNGGLLIVLLTLIVTVLIFRPPHIIERQSNLSIIFAVILVIDAFFHFGKILLDQKKAFGLVGAPAIQIGLAMVLIGSVLLFYTVVNYYLKSQQ